MYGFRLPYFHVVDVQSEAPSEIPYGVRMIGAPLEWSETKGKGIRVAIIDTGKPNHPDLRIADYVDFTDTGVEDRRGHSTHCCGIIAANGKIKGVAPEVDLFALKIFPDQGGASPQAIANALQWCRENKIDVVSMSFGSLASDNLIYEEIKKCYEAGIILVASAGNYGKDYGVLYPAKYSEVLAVAAVDINKVAAAWSAYGKELDLAAAGVAVYSTYLSSQYALLSGTSMACPHIAGACAIIQAKALKRFGRKLTPAEMRMALDLYADDLGDPGRDERYGFGVFSFGRFHDSEVIQHEVVLTIGEKDYFVDGQKKTMDTAPFIKDERTFVPVRFVAEGLGAQVEWDEKTQKVWIKK